jgi:DNA-binding NtrC family response regulator
MSTPNRAIPERKQHLLIVDDEAPIRELLSQYLSRLGYRVTAVAGSREADEVVVTSPPDLIIADLQLGNEDGLIMIARLKAKLPDTPVILLTGILFDEEVVNKTLRPHIAAYFQKTAPLKRITEEIRRLIESK